MGTQVLHPQDILIERNRFNPTRRKSLTRTESSARSKKKKEFVVGEVTILKRGKESGDLVAPKQIRVQAGCKEEVYAGSAIPSSPSPTQLPFPTFSLSKVKSFDDSATRDLRRLLGLD